MIVCFLTMCAVVDREWLIVLHAGCKRGSGVLVGRQSTFVSKARCAGKKKKKKKKLWPYGRAAPEWLSLVFMCLRRRAHFSFASPPGQSCGQMEHTVLESIVPPPPPRRVSFFLYFTVSQCLVTSVSLFQRRCAHSSFFFFLYIVGAASDLRLKRRC